MNYQRVRLQGQLREKIKEALLEKRDYLRSLPGHKRAKVEELIINKVKEEFMGYSNRKGNKNAEKSVEVQETNTENVDSEDENRKTEQVSGESEGSGTENSSDLGETQDGRLDESQSDLEKKLNGFTDDQLKEIAKDKNISFGNATKRKTLIKKILER